jgi:hypothetical protein
VFYIRSGLDLLKTAADIVHLYTFCITYNKDLYVRVIFFILVFVRQLALRPLWPIVPASGDSEDDCGEADGM